MKTQVRLVRADVRAEANRLSGAGWELEMSPTNHVHVYCPACGTRVIGLPSTPSRSGRWRVRTRTTTRTHASRCWSIETRGRSSRDGSMPKHPARH